MQLVSLSSPAREDSEGREDGCKSIMQPLWRENRTSRRTRTGGCGCLARAACVCVNFAADARCTSMMGSSPIFLRLPFSVTILADWWKMLVERAIHVWHPIYLQGVCVRVRGDEKGWIVRAVTGSNTIGFR